MDALIATREQGQGLVEYALIILFIALAVAASVALFGSALGNTYQTIADAIPTG